MVIKMRRRILNVGCGTDAYGTDFVDLYPSRKGVIKCNVEKEKLPFGNNSFDEIYSKNLFEHLKNLSFVLKEMARVLKPGGKLVLRTDNAGFWLFHNTKSKWKIHYGGYERIGAHGKKDKHYALFTTHHIKNHLEDVGIKVIRTEYYSDFQHLSPLIRSISWLLSRTRFKPMAYPQILVIGVKTSLSKR